MKDHKKPYYEWFIETYLTRNQKEHLKPDLISELVVGYNSRHRKFDSVGSDPNDTILFLLGVDNFKDDQTTFGNVYN